LKITEKDVLYVAGLANLELSDEEITRFAGDLDSILAYVDKLNELDTSNVEPMAQVLYKPGGADTLREDEVQPSLAREKSLANAPESAAGQFKTPKVIER
jgi:aspartyl-tRNA(Asn)/glutamyl-tRNA(Gln) amidotransferase subunit C